MPPRSASGIGGFLFVWSVMPGGLKEEGGAGRPGGGLREAALEASRRAYAPWSGLSVGAALEDGDGRRFTGCNVENSSFGGTVCAERVALLKMASEGGRRFERMYVYSGDGLPPCGLCLQVMAEFAGGGDPPVTIGDGAGRERTLPLGGLLPLAFSLGRPVP